MQHVLTSLAWAVGLASISPVVTPSLSRFDITELDQHISPCADFDAFVNAKWLAAHPMPADLLEWNTFLLLQERSLQAQHEIAEDAARHAATARAGSIEQKIGYLYASGMDEAAIEKAGYDPIRPQLARIDALKSSADIAAYLRDSHARGAGGVFRFSAGADLKDSGRQIAYVRQGGLGLSTADYYTKPNFAPSRAAYTARIERMLQLTGISAAHARKQAKAVMAFETRLASASLMPTELREPENRYHFVSIAEAGKVTPHFDWAAFFQAQGADVTDGFSLSQPKFFAEFDQMLVETPVADWQAYLRFHTVDQAAPYLSKIFQQQGLDTSASDNELKARWKRVLDTINGSMGMALGQLYAARYSSPESRQRAQGLVNDLRSAYKARIENLEWMSAETKQKALKKWAHLTPMVGYPDTWRDWSGLTLKPDDYFGNVQAAAKFNHDDMVGKIGKPVDRSEWGMTPQTVNAYYSAPRNEIVLPAAILQPPIFDTKADDALNYGAIGAVIGHEMGHAYDDEGSRFDARGNYADWWTDADRKAFDERTAKLAAQFSSYEALPGKFVNGQLTLGENIGDLAGLNIAYDALQMALARDPVEAKQVVDGYTQDQRFFLSWARAWRGQARSFAQFTRLDTDPHAPAKFRVIGAPSNMAAFAQAFQCKTGDKMVRSGEQQVKIW